MTSMSSTGRADAHGVFRRGRLALQFVEPLHLLVRAAGHEQRGEHWRKAGFSLAPAAAHQRQQRLGLFDASAAAPRLRRPREAAVEDELADALGMPHRIGDRERAALRDAEQREALEPRRVDHAFEIAHEGLERDVVDVPVGQAVAARVIADQPVLGGERVQQWLQTGLSQSYSRWLSQLAALTSGGPCPTSA